MLKTRCKARKEECHFCWHERFTKTKSGIKLAARFNVSAHQSSAKRCWKGSRWVSLFTYLCNFLSLISSCRMHATICQKNKNNQMLLDFFFKLADQHAKKAEIPRSNVCFLLIEMRDEALVSNQGVSANPLVSVRKRPKKTKTQQIIKKSSLTAKLIQS